MKKNSIVITTIFPPTRAISDYVGLGHNLYVVGDTKTPPSWNHVNCEFLSIKEQIKLFPKFAKLIPTGHYARKNIGYLIAMKEGDIIETDDDNLPYDFFPNFVTREIKTTCITARKFFNTFVYMSNDEKKIWPRGYPLNYISLDQDFKTDISIGSFPLQQSLADRDSDFDAIYRLTNGKEITFKKGTIFSLAKHTYAPINSQNTFWQKEAFLFMYLPCTVNSRLTDIYRGYIAQRLLWEIGHQALFLSPSVYQKRNAHNYLKDFEEEVPIYLGIEKFIDILEITKLVGSAEEKMISLYKSLIRENFLQKEELVILREWIRLVASSNI